MKKVLPTSDKDSQEVDLHDTSIKGREEEVIDQEGKTKTGSNDGERAFEEGLENNNDTEE